jgi:hypothetical protein
VRRAAALWLTAAFTAMSLSAMAGMVMTPEAAPDELESALREAYPGQAERMAKLLGNDPPHAGINPLLIQLIIYGSIVAIVMLVGIIAIIGYNVSKKGKERERLGPP